MRACMARKRRGANAQPQPDSAAIRVNRKRACFLPKACGENAQPLRSRIVLQRMWSGIEQICPLACAKRGRQNPILQRCASRLRAIHTMGKQRRGGLRNALCNMIFIGIISGQKPQRIGKDGHMPARRIRSKNNAWSKRLAEMVGEHKAHRIQLFLRRGKRFLKRMAL